MRATLTSKSEPPPSHLRQSPCPVLHCTHRHCCCHHCCRLYHHFHCCFPLSLSSAQSCCLYSACRLQFRHLFLSCLSAAAVRCFPYVARSLSPPLVSCSTEPVRVQLPRAAQDQTQSSLAPRSPLPSPLLNLHPSEEGAATSKAIIDEWTACIATNHCALLFPIV